MIRPAIPAAGGNHHSGKARRPVVLRACFQAIFLLGVAVAAALANERFNPASRIALAREITLDEAASLSAHEKILWIDARPAAAFSNQHVPGAVWLAEEGWEEGLPNFVEAWTPGQPIVVYCASEQCGSSRSVARRLIREFNATHVHYLKGGWETLQSRAK